MRIIGARAIFENPFKSFMSDEQYMEQMLKQIEKVGRTCYKSEKLITEDSYKSFIKGLINRGHEAMLEHGSFTVRFIVDRGVSHELVRHRVASFAQESTRYCNYGKSGEVAFIKPCFWDDSSVEMELWETTCSIAEEKYLELLSVGRTPQEARSVLPNSLKTEVIMTANFREWRHFFKLRAVGTTGKPHPQMEEVTIPLLHYLQNICPVMFDDIIWGNNK